MFTKKFLSTAEIFGAIPSTKTPAPDDLFAITKINDQPRHECYFEEGSGSNLPALVVPHDDDEVGFFADVATYYPAWSPITAHIHVLRNDEIPDKASLTRVKSKSKAGRRPDTSKLSIWTALAYTEAASMSANHNPSEPEPSYALCRRTLAFSLARASALHPTFEIDNVVEKWFKLHVSISNAPSRPLMETTVFLARFLCSGGISPSPAGNQFDEMYPVLRDLNLASYQENDVRIQHYLLEYHPSISPLIEELSGDFDRRMEVFQNIVEHVRHAPHSDLIDSATLAFVANRILPGSMRYIKVLTRLLKTYPSLLLWYGFFSALSERYSSESIAIAIDRKLQRDITHHFDFRNRPEVDISITEFHTLSRISLKSISLRPVQPRSVYASLFPGLNVFFRMGEDPTDVENKESEMLSQFRNREKLLSAIISEAQKILSTPINDYDSSSKQSKSRYNRERY